MSDYILGIDPGTTETAYCLCRVCTIQEYCRPLKIEQFAKISNEEMVEVLLVILETMTERRNNITVAIEHLESYGMAVGKSTFETAYFIGRLTEIASNSRYSDMVEVTRIYRHEEKDTICHSMKANDATIKQALVDEFADEPNVNHGKGSKKNPDYFYGFKADCWSAFAICYTQYMKYLLEDMAIQEDEEENEELDY